MGFPMSYRWSAYVTLSPQWLAQQTILCFFLNKIQLQSNSLIQFLCVETSSGKVVVVGAKRNP